MSDTKMSKSDFIKSVKKAMDVYELGYALADSQLPVSVISRVVLSESPLVNKEYTEMYREIISDDAAFIVESEVGSQRYRLVYFGTEAGWCLDGKRGGAYREKEYDFDVDELNKVHVSLNCLTKEDWMIPLDKYVNICCVSIEDFFDDAYENMVNVSGLVGAKEAGDLLVDYLKNYDFKVTSFGDTSFERCSFGVITAEDENGTEYKFGFSRPRLFRKDDRKSMFGLEY